MEKLTTVWLVAGLGCFGLAGIVEGYLPIAQLTKIKYQKLEEIAPDPSPAWVDLSQRFPEAFKKYYGEPTGASFREALKLGRDTYIGEACWHCHSQYVRPISNEDVRFGKVSYSSEYMNEMFLPHLFGTRRVGPDLDPRERAPRQRLARRPLLRPHHRGAELRDAAVHMVLRRRGAQQARVRGHRLRAVAGELGDPGRAPS